MSGTQMRDHGGGVDAAVAQFGGTRNGWLDLSTGINPVAYDVPPVSASAWTTLPDRDAMTALVDAARAFWAVPQDAAILAVPGASAAIAQIPRLAAAGRVWIPAPTYNEHAASFALNGWEVSETADQAEACVLVHPNNPDGRLWRASDAVGGMRVIDESFCDVTPDHSLIGEAGRAGTLVLKSFGKFWGLAGLRLGFVIGDVRLIHSLAQMLGPWAVSGPALEIGRQALADLTWAQVTRARLASDAARLDRLMIAQGAAVVGGTTLFRLYDVGAAAAFQDRLARHHVWSRVFPYNSRWLRLGLPGPAGWDHLMKALA